MLQDTVAVVPAVVDTIKVAADSLATAVGGQVGAQIATFFALALAVVTKFAVDLAKQASTKLATAPAPVKAIVAVLFAQVATWVTVKTGILVNPNVDVLETTVSGLVVSLSAIGVHALTKLVPKKV